MFVTVSCGFFFKEAGFKMAMLNLMTWLNAISPARERSVFIYEISVAIASKKSLVTVQLVFLMC